MQSMCVCIYIYIYIYIKYVCIHICELIQMDIPVLSEQLCVDTGCSREDLPRVVDNRDRW